MKKAPHSAPGKTGLFSGEAGIVICLLACVILSWCAANARWDAGSWNLPSAYSAPCTSDVLTTLSGIKAVSDGHILPMLWKNVSELGAPAGANWNDLPSTEEFALYFQGLLGKAFGMFVGLNLSLLINHLLGAGVFYLVARFSDCDRKWSFVGGLAFGLAPYIFAQSPHHFTVAAVWHVPLFIPVWRWVSTGEGVAPWSKRFWISAAIAFLTGMQNVYYTNILCQLTLLGGLLVFFRTRSFPALISCFGIILSAALAFGLMNLDTWTYKLVYGPNTGALVREYKWLEIYGLKIVDLFVPPVTHRSDLLAGFAIRHRAEAPLQDEGSYLGILGILSLGLLVFTTATAFVRKRYSEIPLEAWQVFWIVAVFTTGGLNAIVGALGFTMFRTGCRYSVVILAIVLLFAARRMAALPLRCGLTSLLALLAAALVLWDQVPRPPDRKETEAIAFQIESDREIVEKMEAALPAGAMVFQIPIMDFPESPVPGLSPYDHLRPYLFSHHLRYSFGSMKGREDTRWQRNLTQLSLADAVAKLRGLGFRAILISRNGFPDKAKGFLQSLSTLGHSQIIESPAGDLVCVVLPPV